MATLEETRAVRKKLKEAMPDLPIDIRRIEAEGSFGISIILEDPQELETLPTEIDGVPIVLKTCTGPVSKHKKGPAEKQ